MFSRIKRFLKRWPGLYRPLQHLWYKMREYIETRVLGTLVQEWIWRTRHLYKGKRWAQDYRESVNHPHRQLLVERISTYEPFKSILEIGCNAGPNLYLLSKKYPDAALSGIDINASAILEGKQWFSEEGIKNVKLSVLKADELDRFADKSTDVTFTDATLLYIGPDKIKNVLSNLTRITRKALVLNEWHTEKNNIDYKKDSYYEGHWVYNYKDLLRNTVDDPRIIIRKIPKELWGGSGWEEYGAIIEVKL